MISNFWRDKKVLVTGGAGFIGSHLVEKLLAKKAKVTVLSYTDLKESENLQEIKGRFKFIKGDARHQKMADKACQNQDIVINLAAKIGGIGYLRSHPGAVFHDNLLMAIVMLEAARKAGVERFLAVSSACVYPRNCSVPTPETEGFQDQPEPINEAYGWVKRMTEKMASYYHQEFKMKIAIVRPYNCYGPRDRFDPKHSNVVASLIKKVVDGQDPIVVWGSGKQTRAFLYVEDLVEGMMLAIEKYPVADAVNLGSNEETTVKGLIEKILEIAGVKRRVVFDISKPDGSPRRKSDNQKAREKLGFVAKTKLNQGLKKTIKWYNRRVNK